MDELIQHLAKKRRETRLWFEQLALYSEPSVEHHIRTISFRRGVNIIWAHEPDEKSTSVGFHAAGHGVGKSSLCMLLRYCLGDSGKAIDRMLDEVCTEFGLGGVAAVVHIGSEVFTVFRYFNSLKGGFVALGRDIENLLETKGTLSFKEFAILLADKMMSKVSPKRIPETGQDIEWSHVLAWLARDQGARFMGFFNWREGEGVGFQRAKQDPPILMRAVLGLMGTKESEVLAQIRKFTRDEEKAAEKIAELEAEPKLIQKRIESELRAWLGVAESLPIRVDDLFKESVETKLAEKKNEAVTKLANLEKQAETKASEIVDLRVEEKALAAEFKKHDDAFNSWNTALGDNESSLKKLAEFKHELRTKAGPCELGDVAFQECKHIQFRINSNSFQDGKDKNTLTSALAECAKRAQDARKQKEAVAAPLEQVKKKLETAKREHSVLTHQCDQARFDVGRDKNLLAELKRWVKSAGSSENDQRIKQAQQARKDIQHNLSLAKVGFEQIKNARSGRENSLSALTDMLARAFFANEAGGALVLRDETKPFRISLRGGEAYRVLEVLLGDLVCLLDSSDPASAFPGLLIHDCPREADMGPHPYREYLRLVETIDRDAFGNDAPFQYIITTTTTPPPESMRIKPYLIETFDPSHEDGLLFKKRFKAFSQQENLMAVDA